MLSEAQEELAEHFRIIKRQKVKEAITFIEKDVVGMQELHSYAIIVTLSIDNYDVDCILVDSGSIVDVLYFSTFSRMNLTVDHGKI